MKKFYVAASRLVVLGALALIGSAAYAECDTTQVVEVSIEKMRFVPAHIDVCPGQTVRWTNNEPASAPRPMKHTITTDPAVAKDKKHASSPEGADVFDSGLIAPGETFEHTFTVVGDYKYFCRPHEMMGHLGTLTVVAE